MEEVISVKVVGCVKPTLMKAWVFPLLTVKSFRMGNLVLVAIDMKLEEERRQAWEVTLLILLLSMLSTVN